MILQIDDIKKSFFRKNVLKGVSLVFESGKTYALLGENGAGKTTLAEIIAGNLLRDSGEIFLDEKSLELESARDAQSKGIFLVEQRPLLSDQLTGLENIVLGSEPVSAGFMINRKAAKKRIGELADSAGLSVDFDKKAQDYSAGERFFVSFLAALYRNPAFLILDEPSATLDKDEKRLLFDWIEKLSAAGLCVILITHNFEEARKNADRIVVLRDGLVRQVFEGGDKADPDLIYSAIFGNGGEAADPGENGIETEEDLTELICSEPVLRADNLTLRPQNGPALFDISFSAEKGRITAIYGQLEAGLSTLENLVCGMISKKDFSASKKAGSISFYSKSGYFSAEDLRRLKVGFVPLNKQFRAAHPDLTVKQMLCSVSPDEAEVLADSGINCLLFDKVSTLSGGMLQKLIITREVHLAPELLILANPTYGLDSEKSLALARELQKLAAQGIAVLILSVTKEGIESVAHKSYELVGGKLTPAEKPATAVASGKTAAGAKTEPGAAGRAGAKLSPMLKLKPAGNTDKVSAAAPGEPGAKPIPAENTEKVLKPAKNPAAILKSLKIGSEKISVLVSLVISFVCALLLIAFSAPKPFDAIVAFFAAPFTSAYYTGSFLNTAALLLCAGMGSAISLYSGNLNLGGEAQVYLGGFVTAVLLSKCGSLPPVMLLPVMIAASAASGLIAFASAALQRLCGITVLLTTFLVSKGVIPIIDNAIATDFRGQSGNLLATPFIGPQFRLAQLLPPSTFNASVFAVLILLVVFCIFMLRTKGGQKLRIAGIAPEFARYSGFGVEKITDRALFVSGALHGLTGFFAVTGTYFTCHSGFYAGFGWNALTVALIASGSPLLLFPSALVLSYIFTASNKLVLTGSLSVDITPVVQAVILLLISARFLLKRNKKRQL
ncbi:MAG: ATP-binding cassette domain-containing protein [Treponemataceae bacterium]|nr:ATP-binding cassette domain-containing protein [Treponemataceae bacterium]